MRRDITKEFLKKVSESETIERVYDGFYLFQKFNVIVRLTRILKRWRTAKRHWFLVKMSLMVRVYQPEKRIFSLKIMITLLGH